MHFRKVNEIEHWHKSCSKKKAGFGNGPKPALNLSEAECLTDLPANGRSMLSVGDRRI